MATDLPEPVPATELLFGIKAKTWGVHLDPLVLRAVTDHIKTAIAALPADVEWELAVYDKDKIVDREGSRRG